MNHEMYHHTCTIQARRQTGMNTIGEPVMDWVDERTNVPCLFQMMSADMVLRVYGEGVIRAAKLFLPSTVTITENTRRVTTTQAGYSGAWIVKGVYPKYWFNGLDHYEVNLIPDMSTGAGQ